MKLRHLSIDGTQTPREKPMSKIYSFSAAAKSMSFVAAFVLFAPVAFAAIMQASQIVA